jgi:hypothetical protein
LALDLRGLAASVRAIAALEWTLGHPRHELAATPLAGASGCRLLRPCGGQDGRSAGASVPGSVTSRSGASISARRTGANGNKGQRDQNTPPAPFTASSGDPLAAMYGPPQHECTWSRGGPVSACHRPASLPPMLQMSRPRRWPRAWPTLRRDCASRSHQSRLS